MNITTLSLRDLEYVVAVADQRHFGKAARFVGVSQPALSNQIRKVEDFLNVLIFDRSQKQVAITAIGVALVEQARVVLRDASRLQELAQQQAKPLSSRFRLGAIASLAPYYFAKILKPLRSKWPELQLMVREGLTNQLLDDLRHDRLDAVLAAPTFDAEEFKCRSVGFERFWLAAPKGHPIAERKRARTGDLKPSEMVLLEDGHCLKDQTLEFCPTRSRAQVHGQPLQFQASSVETLRALVASGLGYTLLPELAVGPNPALSELVDYRPFDPADGRVGREIILVSLKDRERTSDLDALAESLTQVKI